jgi:hypothetical protein
VSKSATMHFRYGQGADARRDSSQRHLWRRFLPVRPGVSLSIPAVSHWHEVRKGGRRRKNSRRADDASGETLLAGVKTSAIGQRALGPGLPFQGSNPAPPVCRHRVCLTNGTFSGQLACRDPSLFFQSRHAAKALDKPAYLLGRHVRSSARAMVALCPTTTRRRQFDTSFFTTERADVNPRCRSALLLS